MTLKLATDVLVTDVLVIGGGLAGCWAAIAAAQAGGDIVLAEKGHVGTSGVTATAGPGHWWVPPDPGARDAAVAKRLAAGEGLGEAAWMERILEETWRTLPTLAAYYDFPADERGQVQYRALRGPEYLRALRRHALDLGVRILDHAPALELLRGREGRVVGAAGLLPQQDRDWTIRAGAVVLATGGCGFRSHLLGAGNNTGDGLLMAAEAGATLSGMEFSACYTVAPARTTMTRSMSYAFATYYDEAGERLSIPSGPDQSGPLARALSNGRVFCDLSRMPHDIRAMLPHISPNVMLPFARRAIDPFGQRFEITLRGEGTIRGVGGLRIAGADCATGIDGLYAAGDVASREAVTGAVSGGGAVNASWALSSGRWAGHAAAGFARLHRNPDARAEAIGEAGLRPRARGGRMSDAPDHAALVRSVQSEMLPPGPQLFRCGDALSASLARLDALWTVMRDASGSGGIRDRLRRREAAAMTATARWCIGAAEARTESRGMHRRVDHPARQAEFAARVSTGGLDRRWARLDASPAALRAAS